MQSKDNTALSRELLNLYADNNSLQAFKRKPMNKRVFDVELNVFDFNSDDEDDISGKLADSVRDLIKNSDSIFYEKIRAICNNPLFLEGLKGKRKITPTAPISQNIIEIAQTYAIHKDQLAKIIQVERAFLEEVKKENSHELLKHTDVQTRIDALTKLQNHCGKRKANSTDKKYPDKKPHIEDSPVDTHRQTPPIETQPITKLTCRVLFLRIKFLFDSINTKTEHEEIFKAHLYLASALKNASSLPINFENIDIDQKILPNLIKILSKDNFEHLTLCLEQLEANLSDEVTGKVLTIYQKIHSIEDKLYEIAPLPLLPENTKLPIPDLSLLFKKNNNFATGETSTLQNSSTNIPHKS